MGSNWKPRDSKQGGDIRNPWPPFRGVEWILHVQVCEQEPEEQKRRYKKVGSNWKPRDSKQGGDIRNPRPPFRGVEWILHVQVCEQEQLSNGHYMSTGTTVKNEYNKHEQSPLGQSILAPETATNCLVIRTKGRRENALAVQLKELWWYKGYDKSTQQICGIFFLVKNVVLTRCLCVCPIPMCICTHKNDHVRTLWITETGKDPASTCRSG